MATLRSILLEPLPYFVLALVGLLRIAVDPASRTFGMVTGVVAFTFAGISVLSYRRTRNLGTTDDRARDWSSVTLKHQVLPLVAGTAVGLVASVLIGLPAAILGALTTAAVAGTALMLDRRRDGTSPGQFDAPVWAQVIILSLIVAAVVGYFAPEFVKLRN